MKRNIFKEPGSKNFSTMHHGKQLDRHIRSHPPLLTQPPKRPTPIRTRDDEGNAPAGRIVKSAQSSLVPLYSSGELPSIFSSQPNQEFRRSNSPELTKTDEAPVASLRRNKKRESDNAPATPNSLDKCANGTLLAPSRDVVSPTGQEVSLSLESGPRDSSASNDDEDAQWKVMEELHRQLRAASKIVTVLKAKVQSLTEEKARLEEREAVNASRLDALLASEAAWRAKVSELRPRHPRRDRSKKKSAVHPPPSVIQKRDFRFCACSAIRRARAPRRRRRRGCRNPPTFRPRKRAARKPRRAPLHGLPSASFSPRGARGVRGGVRRRRRAAAPPRSRTPRRPS